MIRWEILEVIERGGVLVEATLYRPLGQHDSHSSGYQLPFAPEDDVKQLIRAVLFDGFEPVSQSVCPLPDGTIQKHWVFRMQAAS
jgi:hypothetical protein